MYGSVPAYIYMQSLKYKFIRVHYLGKVSQNAPESISEHLKLENFLEGHAPRPFLAYSIALCPYLSIILVPALSMSINEYFIIGY